MRLHRWKVAQQSEHVEEDAVGAHAVELPTGHDALAVAVTGATLSVAVAIGVAHHRLAVSACADRRRGIDECAGNHPSCDCHETGESHLHHSTSIIEKGNSET
jgi:hypothetical protein